MDDERIPDAEWVDRHSVTCAICGGLADERRTAHIVDDLELIGPALVTEAPARVIAIRTAVAEFGEGEAHQGCLGVFRDHLVESGARLDGTFEIEARYHR